MISTAFFVLFPDKTTLQVISGPQQYQGVKLKMAALLIGWCQVAAQNTRPRQHKRLLHCLLNFLHTPSGDETLLTGRLYQEAALLTG